MKTLISLTALAAFVATGSLFAQTPAFSKPSGYISQTLVANRINVVGVPLLKPTLATGVITAVNGANVSASATDFSAVLTAGKMIILEVLSGTAAGVVQEFNTWSGTSISLPAAIPGLAIGDQFSVRAAHTLQELFPSGTLRTGNLNAAAADKVWVPIGGGQYTRYFVKINTNAGWHTTSNGTVIDQINAITADIPVIYTDGLLVQTGSNPITPLVFTGEVKKTPSSALAQTGQLNLISIIPPVGLTLFTSGLQSQLATGNLNATAADKLWVPQPDGSFKRYFVKINSNAGWHTTSNGTVIDQIPAITVDVPLPQGAYIQRVAAGNKVFTFNVPASYSSL
jgi:hypothetical protein